MKKIRLAPAAGIGLTLMFSSQLQANTISLIDEEGVALAPGSGIQYTASCDPAADICMQGFLEQDVVVGNVNPALDPALASVTPDGQATGYLDATFNAWASGSGFDAANEASFLNVLLGQVGDPDVVAGDSFKDDAGGSTFTTNREYFSIKQAGFIAFFKNVSGGDLTVAFNPNDFSHWSGHGRVVPLPAAAWLFGSAVLGLVAIGRRRRTDEGSPAY